MIFAKRGEIFVNVRPLQLALREFGVVFSDPRALAIIFTVGLIAGLAGPFGTFEALTLPARLAYWIAIAFGTYAAGLIGGTTLACWLTPEREPFWLRIAALSLGASAPVTLLVLMVNFAFLPGAFAGWGTLWLYFYCLAICAALMIVIEGYIAPTMGRQAVPETEAPAPPPAILDRLPAGVRGPLRSMSMADHYVEVVTAKGKAMVLMRLTDAIAETRGADGIQIHRSHWVALSAIADLKSAAGRWFVVLNDGRNLPVSRTYLTDLRARLGRSGGALDSSAK